MKRSVEVIEQLEHLPDLKSGWNALARKQQNPLVDFDWFYCCAQTINRECPLRVVVVWQDHEIIAIAPLCLSSTEGLKTLELLGTTTLFEPTNFLYADTDALLFLLRNVAKLGFPMVLSRIPDETHWREVLDVLRWNIGPILVSQAAASTFLRLPPSWQDFCTRLSSRARNDIRRKRKRVSKFGTMTTEFTRPDEFRFTNTFNSVVNVENRGWKGRQGTSLLKNARQREFFEAYASKARERGTLQFCFLNVDEYPIAMQIGVLEHDALWILKIGYDEAFAWCSPGFVLTAEALGNCVERGVNKYEFLGAEEPWQSYWPIERHRLMNIFLFPYGWRGLWGFGRFSGQVLFRRLIALVRHGSPTRVAKEETASRSE